MILKSFELEKNIKSILNYKFVLIYGENIGLKETLNANIIITNGILTHVFHLVHLLMVFIRARDIGM